MKYNSWIKILVVLTSIVCSSTAIALPFIITPKSPLPTQVNTGSTVIALYTVTNRTGSTRTGNYVKYLPPNTSQVTVDSNYADLCGATFTLTPYGTAGSSCTLELAVTGTVNDSDPNPQHHLFVCFSGGYTCAGTSQGLSVTSNATTVAIAAGGYTTKHLPFIMKSANHLNTWAPTTLTLPNNFFAAQFGLQTTICSGNTCLSGGDYVVSGTGISKPLLLMSNTSGNQWSAMSLPLPADIKNSMGGLAIFSSVHCANALCASVGFYLDTHNATRALLEISTNQGNTWTIPTLTLPANNAASFAKVICTNNGCIGGGVYSDTLNVTQPLLLISDSAANNWITPAMQLPNDYANTGSIKTINPFKNTILSGGSYQSTTVTKPLFLISSDNGNHWNAAMVNLPGDFNDQGEISAASCNGTVCVATGSYVNTTSTTRALLLTTLNGSTWNAAALPLPNDFSGNDTINQINCSMNGCSAVGSYTSTNATTQPLLYVSSNGTTWRVATFTLPSDFVDNANLSAVQCNNTDCVAIGEYSTDTLDKPLILISTNSGASWAPPGSITLPSDFATTATLNAISNAAY